MFKAGDVCKVKKSKYLAPGSLVKILLEFQTDIYLCGNESGNTIVVAENSIKSLYELALKSDAPDRETLATLLREEADKQAKDTVCITLLRIAECIESMEVSE